MSASPCSILGITLALNSWWGLALLLPIARSVMHLGVIRREERYLELKFGGDYLRYKSASPRYVGLWLALRFSAVAGKLRGSR